MGVESKADPDPPFLEPEKGDEEEAEEDDEEGGEYDEEGGSCCGECEKQELLQPSFFQVVSIPVAASIGLFVGCAIALVCSFHLHAAATPCCPAWHGRRRAVSKDGWLIDIGPR